MYWAKWKPQVSIATRRPKTLWIMMLMACFMIYFISRINTYSVDFTQLAKPSFTILDEIKERRSFGYLDNIQLKNLLHLTKSLSSPESPCKAPPKLVVLVKSSCPNKEQRMAIRDTWGYKATSLELPVVFFVGQCPSCRAENHEFGDMVEVGFVDSYVNNTLKTLARYKWYLENCANAQYLVMTDDDVVLVVHLLADFLNTGIGYSVFGPLYHRSYVERKANSKWYIPEWVYSEAYFPPYVGGGSYVMNGSVVRALYEASLESRFLGVADDALFTGVAADMIGLHRVTDARRFPTWKYLDVNCGEKSAFAVAKLSPQEIRTYWEKRMKKCKLVL